MVNPDPSKQAQEATVSRMLQKANHNPVYFDHNTVQQVPSQKHLGMYLDTELNFQEHLNNVLSKVKKTIRLLCKLQICLPLFYCLKVFCSREKLYQKLGLESLRKTMVQ